LKRRLLGAALAVIIAGSVGHAAGKPPAKQGPGVTTLEPANGDGWRLSEDPGDPFTPVGVIGGHSLNADSGLGNPVSIGAAPANFAPAKAAEPPKTTGPAKRAVGWLPEPVTWLLLLIGVAMIGFALRGLVAARRRLARLEDLDS